MDEGDETRTPDKYVDPTHFYTPAELGLDPDNTEQIFWLEATYGTGWDVPEEPYEIEVQLIRDGSTL